MLMVVKPGMVLISFRYSLPVPRSRKKSTRAIPQQSTARKASTARRRTSAVASSGIGAGISNFELSLTYLAWSVSYTHLRAHETRHELVCRLLLAKKKKYYLLYTSPSPLEELKYRKQYSTNK